MMRRRYSVWLTIVVVVLFLAYAGELLATTPSICAGDKHSLAIKSDGTLWAWGYNETGQLGDGTTVNGSSPIQIGTDHWTIIAAGFLHSVGLKLDGTLWAWGGNGYGELGDGTTTDRHSPVQIGTGTGYFRIRAWDGLSRETISEVRTFTIQ